MMNLAGIIMKVSKETNMGAKILRV